MDLIDSNLKSINFLQLKIMQYQTKIKIFLSLEMLKNRVDLYIILCFSVLPQT